jgi:hypothetical protein
MTVEEVTGTRTICGLHEDVEKSLLSLELRARRLGEPQDRKNFGLWFG